MIAKGTGFVRGPVTKKVGSRLASHIKYLQHGSELGEGEHREDRAIFSADHDDVKRADAVRGTLEHTSTAVDFHKVVLSPTEQEAAGIDDWKVFTRNVMSDLEQHLGMDLHWYAVRQAHDRENIDAPHIHVVIAGRGENRTAGRNEPVKLYAQGHHPTDKERDDFAIMAKSGHEHSHAEFNQELERSLQTIDLHDSLAHPEPELSRGLER